LECRGLAGSVRADQPEDLAGLDCEIDPANRFDNAITFGEMADTDYGPRSPIALHDWAGGLMIRRYDLFR
jgi:hypothetical protein